MTRWHVLTGEFPPDTGGVAQFTAAIAGGLSSRGIDLHVWAPGRETRPAADSAPPAAFRVHALPDHFGPRSRAALREAVNPGEVVLLQYVPNALGARGANVAFCRWLAAQARRGCDVRVVFHEPFFYFGWQSPGRNMLALVQRVMATLLLRASSIAYLSTSSWEPVLRRYARRGARFEWLPVPSAVPFVDDAEGVRRLRASLGGRVIVGHFSAYPGDVRLPLRLALQDVLAGHLDAGILCIGRGSAEMAASIGDAERVHATGQLDPRDLSRALQACDLFVQPYPDGATTRRTSLTTLLAHGAAIVTTSGPNTEPLWTADGDVVAFAPAGERRVLATEVTRLIGNAARRQELGARARVLYDRHFGLECAVNALLA